MIRALSGLACVLSTLGLLACGPAAPEATQPTTPATAQPTAAPTATATAQGSAPTGARGLAAADNDPALVETARAALLCIDKAECPAQQKWYEPFMMRSQQVDQKTLVNFIEDDDPRVRALGAGVLRGNKGKPGFHVDAGMSARVLTALEREQDERTGKEIAIAAGTIDLRATGLEERMLKLVRSDKRRWARTEVLRTLLDMNWDNPTVVAAVKQLVDDPDSDVGREAVDAFDVHELREQACSFWVANLTHKDSGVADRCVFQMVYLSKCRAQEGALMDALEKRPIASPENLDGLCRGREDSDKTKKRMTAVMDRWSQDASLQAYQRVQALKVLAQCDPKQATKTAAALAKDADEYIRKEAAEIANAKSKP